MILDDALRLTGALMALAFIQQSLEHLDPGRGVRKDGCSSRV
jgi:hypothetical protein